jgi:cytochrome c-type biogenesis protein CcmF
LYYIISNHYFEYHYAWSHSSRSLPSHYIISCFWEGQEGSFLLWIFWNALLGIILIHTNKVWEAPVMVTFALVQAFLASMILGVVIPGLDVKIGSSPFILLRDAMLDAPIFASNPDFVPQDGTGLNPLLQNYWMVIHPPTLFLGFATTLIPFAYCIAGLWKNKFAEWIRPALPWTLFSAIVLGVGILMGAYWAYETLNFGGYWNWDPVENAVYIPWLVLIATIHTMITYKKSGTALRTSVVLAIASFVLVLYATFLTRSGILGNASVHSFTDLGLSGQLLMYLLTFTIGSIVLSIVKWKRIPSDEKEVSTYSREFWIFIGATTLCLAAFQVLASTSIPVYNSIIESFGFLSNLAPPADQIGHYTKFQLWFAIIITILSAIGQFFWWQKIDKKTLVHSLTTPLLITLLVSALFIVLAGVDNLLYIVLLTTSIFSVAANAKILWSVAKNNYKLSGGAVAHIGVAMMLIGILFSSGYSEVVSLNTSGLMISNDETFKKDNDKENKENTLLWLNKPTRMNEYWVTYRGRRIDVRDMPGYIHKELLLPADVEYRSIAKADIVYNGKTYFKKGDTLETYPENTYYEVEYRDKKGRIFNLYPRVQINEQMNGIAPSPDIKRSLGSDLYTYVSATPDPGAEKDWSEMEEHIVSLQDTFFVNDYVAILDNVVRASEVEGIVLTSNDAAVKAKIRVLGEGKDYEVSPTYVIKDRMVGRVPETIDDLGLKVTFNNIDPNTGKFTFGVSTTQKDYIIMKAYEKPLINVLWIGTFVLVIGFTMAIFRRYSEFVKMRNKGMEV